METSIGGMLVMGVLLTMIILLSRTFIVSNQLMGAAIKDAADFSGERARTELTLVATTSTDPNILRADVKNTGNTSISEHDEMDFIVNYSATGTLATVIKRLTYVAAGPASDEWSNGTTTPDTFQRGIWDPGETLSFDARLATQQATATSGVLRISTPNGVVVTGSFAR